MLQWELRFVECERVKSSSKKVADGEIVASEESHV